MPSKISAAEKRVNVAVAKDVLKMLPHFNRVGQSGYLSYHPSDDPDRLAEVGDAKQLQKNIPKIAKFCGVCAKGAMVLAHIHLYDGVDYLPTCAERYATDIFGNQADIIEAAFERYAFDEDDEGFELIGNEAGIFGEQFPDDSRKRLGAIMKNIVVNNGVFNPKDLKNKGPKKKITKMNKLFLAVPFLALLAGCTIVSPGANQEAVLIEKPWIFGHGGIDPEPVTTGQSYAALSTEYIIVGVQPARQDEKFEDLMTGDNVPLTFDAFPRLQVIDSVKLIKVFGEQWYKNNVEQKFRNIVRDEAKKHSMTELISGAVVQDMENTTAASLRIYVEAQQVPIKVIDVTINKINPPNEVMNAIKITAEQQQRIKTEGQRKLAEDARAAAELSRATADKTYVEHMGLTGQQFVSLEQIRMCGEKASCTVILGGSAVQPLVNIK